MESFNASNNIAFIQETRFRANTLNEIEILILGMPTKRRNK